MPLDADQQKDATHERPRSAEIVEFLKDREPKAYTVREIVDGVIGDDTDPGSEIKISIKLHRLTERKEVEKLWYEKNEEEQKYYRISDE